MKYDRLARQRIWRALERIKTNNPGLTWKDIAWQISAQYEVLFHAKYFRRLLDGGLRDQTVGAIVEWITDKHERNFNEVLGAPPPSSSSSKDIRSSEFVLGLQEEGHEQSNSASLLKRMNLPEKFPSLDGFDCQTTKIHLPFAEDCELISVFSPTNSDFALLNFIQCNHTLFHLEGGLANFNDVIGKVPVSVERKHLFSYLWFLRRVVDFVAEIVPMINWVQFETELTSAGLRVRSEAHLTDIFSVPSVEEKDDGFLISFCGVVRRDFFRSEIQVNKSGKAKICDHSLVQSEILVEADYQFPSESNIEPMQKVVVSSHPNSQALCSYILSELSENSVGRLLSQLIRRDMIELVIVPSAKFGCHFDIDHCLLIVTVPSIRHSLECFEILSVFLELRRADIHLSGHRSPDPDLDLMDYAGYQHALNLDILCHMSKFILESNRKNRLLLEETLSSSQRYFLTKYKDGANQEELYDIYSKI